MRRLLSREPELEGFASRLATSDRAKSLVVTPALKKTPRRRASSRVGGVPRQDRGAARTNGRLAGPPLAVGSAAKLAAPKLLWSSVPASDSPRPRPTPDPRDRQSPPFTIGTNPSPIENARRRSPGVSLFSAPASTLVNDSQSSSSALKTPVAAGSSGDTETAAGPSTALKRPLPVSSVGDCFGANLGPVLGPVETGAG